MIISRLSPVRTINVSGKFEEEKKQALCVPLIFFSKIVPLVRQSGNIVEPNRPQKVWRLRIARWTPNSVNTPSEYVIIIVFPLQQWLGECTSVLPYSILLSCL
jgi:hypothetical protein